MPEAAELERDAGRENSEGHRESFAAHHHNVRGDVGSAHARLTLAAGHYSLAAHRFAEAAVEHIRSSKTTAPSQRITDRQRAQTDCGRAASDYWYAGRAYADALEFEQAAGEMEAAAGAYVAEAKLREEDGILEEAFTLRRMAGFRYLDGQRYYLQAAEQLRQRAGEPSSPERAAADGQKAAELESRARTAGDNALAEAPRYHRGYQEAYS